MVKGQKWPLSLDELPDTLTAQHIADHLLVGRNRVYELLELAPSAGGIPNYAIGDGKKASKRVDKSDLIAWKERQKQKRATGS